MLDALSLAATLQGAVDLSDEIYAHNGEPTADSTAKTDLRLLGLAFGAYANAEAKIRALNDLVRSAAILLPIDGTSVAWTTVVRSAIETAARLYWVLAPDGNYRDRAARWTEERLYNIREISKLDNANPALREVKQVEGRIRVEATEAGLHLRSGPPVAVDLIVDLLQREGPITVSGLNRAELAGLFYRYPSATTHATPHGIHGHFGNPANNQHRRMTEPPPFGETLVLSGGLLAAYSTACRALIVLYGWDCEEWDSKMAVLVEPVARALAESDDDAPNEKSP